MSRSKQRVKLTNTIMRSQVSTGVRPNNIDNDN